MLVGDCQWPETRCGDSHTFPKVENEFMFMAVYSSLTNKFTFINLENTLKYT